MCCDPSNLGSLILIWIIPMECNQRFETKLSSSQGERGRGRLFGVNLCWLCTAGFLESLPQYCLLCGQLYPPVLVTFRQM